jgi:FlaA1/EpsC-like NDP-sugar epimerase
MKKVLNQISIPFFLLDLVILTASIFISFRLRFGNEREYLSYRSMGILIFWSAFFVRTIIAYLLNTFSPAILQLSVFQMARRLALATGIGSVVVASIVYARYLAGWYINFPRSVFVTDFLIIFGLSFLVRYIFRLATLHRPVLAVE